MKIKITCNINERIDKYLLNHLDGFTRSQIQQMIKNEKILVNDKPTNNKYLLRENDEVTVIIDKKELEIEKVNLNLDIIYEDEDIAIINKPKGLIVHPALSTKENTMVHGLLYQLDSLSTINGVVRPGIIHRLDKDTSGLLIVCKNDISHKKLSEELKNRNITRKYKALVHGIIPHNKGRIDAPIGRDLLDRKKMNVVENGKKAITNFEVIQRFSKTTLLDIKLETGRTHQIRVHMKYINHPVVGDTVYGIKDEYNEFNQLLHAYKLEFIHPRNNKFMEFEIDLPEYFKNILLNQL